MKIGIKLIQIQIRIHKRYTQATATKTTKRYKIMLSLRYIEMI